MDLMKWNSHTHSSVLCITKISVLIILKHLNPKNDKYESLPGGTGRVVAASAGTEGVSWPVWPV